MDFLGRAKTFVRVVEKGSLSAAARSARVSLAAISRQISSLERELGAQLIVRTTRTLQLTDAGRRFHEHASRLVQAEELARASMQSEQAIGGIVTVATSVDLGMLRVIPGLAQLLAAHPNFSVDLRLDEHTGDLVPGGVDLAIRADLTLPDTSLVAAREVATYRRFAVASPAYLKRHGVPRSAAALAKHASVTSTEATVRWNFVEDDELHTVTLRPTLRATSFLGQRAGALAGIGIAVLPEFVIASDLETRALQVVLPRAKLTPVTA